MFDLIEGFPRQLEHAVEISHTVKLNTTSNPIKNILVSGLGGSGIGACAVAELVTTELNIPLIANNSYTLPKFVNNETLIILSSYSGNTEETVAVAKAVKEKGLTAICITSGGKLQQLAEEFSWDCILIPSGMPPRTCFGYSVILQLCVLNQFGLISNEFKKEAQSTALLLKKEQENMQQSAIQFASALNGKIFALFADQCFQSLVVRAKQQFNENSKSLCWANVFPEFNHNELVAWRGNRSNVPVLLFRSNYEYQRNQLRMAFSKEVIENTGADILEIEAKGNTIFEQYFYHIHLVDWMSFYLAELQHFNPMEIDVLNKLKAHLASIQ